MAELFNGYPIDTTIVFRGEGYLILGYKIYSSARYRIVTDGYADLRINEQRLTR